MNKQKLKYIGIVLAVCLSLAAIGGFYLGTQFGKNTVVEVSKVEK